MISRKTAKLLAKQYHNEFTSLRNSGGRNVTRYVDSADMYDFLYERDYEAWFCNLAKEYMSPREFEEFVMRLHTGESLAKSTDGWTWEKRGQLGQTLLVRLAADLLQRLSTPAKAAYDEEKRKTKYETLLRSVELDGYVFRNGSLLRSEADVLDVQEEHGVLVNLYRDLALVDFETMKHHLDKSEEHYVAGGWDDSISNSRRFLEQVLREVAAAHSLKETSTEIPKATYETPRLTRDYLETAGLVIEEEKRAIAGLYGVLSHTGGHPYMAEKDQARLLRQLALTIAQFAMLRYKGFTQKPDVILG